MADVKLFTPITMRGLTLDNRIVLSPMCQYASTDGFASDWHMAHLGTYALANLGLVITEATGVEPKGRISPMCLGLYSDAHIEPLKRILKLYRDYGTTKFGIQLAHAGRKSSVLPSFMIRKAVPVGEGGWVPMSPSDYRDDVHTPPTIMTLGGHRGGQARMAQRHPPRRRDRRRYDRAALRPRLSGQPVPVAADQHAAPTSTAAAATTACGSRWKSTISAAPRFRPTSRSASASPPPTGSRAAGASRIRWRWPSC